MESGLDKIRDLLQHLNDVEESSIDVVSSLPMCIHEISTSGKITKMNPAGLKMLNVSNESDVVNTDYLDYVHECDKDRILKLLDDAKNGKMSKFKFKSLNGKYFSSCFAPVVDHGEVNKIIGYTYDIT